MAPYKIGSKRPRKTGQKGSQNSFEYANEYDEFDELDLVMQSKAESERDRKAQADELENATGIKKLKYRAQLWFFSLDWGTQNFVNLIGAVLTLLAVTGIGGLVFAALETNTGISLNESYAAAMVTLKQQLNNATGSDTSYWTNLVGTVGALDPTQLPPNYDTWGFTSYHSFLFAFTIITTIGYGEIAPKTVGGRLFLCAYAIICVPIAGIALAKIATIFMDLAEWSIVGLSPTFRKVFYYSDTSRRGLLGFVAAKSVMKDLLGGTLDEMSFRHAFEVASNMRTEPELNYWEFIRLYLMVDNPDLQRKRRYYRLYVSCTFVVLWLLVGMFSFNHFEQWGYVPSLYFSFVTLSTIGLGDFFPSTKPGADFHFFYCVFGLGLVAVFLSATGDIIMEGEAMELEKVQAQYISQWEEKNKHFVEDVEKSEAAQGADGDAAPAGAGGRGPRSPAARRRLADPNPQDIMARALMLDPQSRDMLLQALLDKYKVLPQFVVEKAEKSVLMSIAESKKKAAREATLPPVDLSKFRPAFPTQRAGAEGGAADDDGVPDFLPTYCQIYEEAPIKLSGVGPQGAPIPPVAGGPAPAESNKLYTGKERLPSEYAYNDARNNGPWGPSGVPPREQAGARQNGSAAGADDGAGPLAAAAFTVLGNDAVPTSRAGVPPQGAGRKNSRYNAEANDNRL